MATVLYDWSETIELRVAADDIVLGHPHPSEGTVLRRFLEAGRPSRLKALIFPIHHGIPEINLQFSDLVAASDVVFGIMGEYWYDTLDQSPMAHWKDKLIRVDMAVDTAHYPLIKGSFNAPGERGFLYIGRNSAEKGIEMLSTSMRQRPQYRRAWIGNGPEIEGVPRLSEWRSLTPEFMRWVAEEYDVVMSFSQSDANPTTLLEAMSWGFAVACTRESGYYGIPSIVELSSTHVEMNVAALDELQHAPSDVLNRMRDANRRLVEQEFTWEKLTSTVWEGLRSRL